MNIFIPSVGQQMRLQADWTFPLYNERRNAGLSRASLDRDIRWGTGIASSPVTLPRDSVLQVDRIFLRKNMGDYDSITFLVVDSPLSRLRPWRAQNRAAIQSGAVRFWAKLDDVNGIEVDLVEGVAFNVELLNADIHSPRACQARADEARMAGAPQVDIEAVMGPRR